MARSKTTAKAPLSVAEVFSTPIDPARHNKRELLILYAVRVFHQQGVHGTGIAEVMKLAGVGKGQFYHYFENKEQFICEVVRFITDDFLTRIAPFTYRLESMDRFDAWFQPYLDFAELPRHLGCPVGGIASEMSPSHPAVRACVALCLQRWVMALAEGLSVLQQKTGAGGDFQPLQLAEEMAAGIQGALLMCRAMQSTRYIYSLRERQRNRLLALLPG